MADDIELVKGKHAEPTADQALWLVIRKATECISYNHDENFIDMVLCPEQQYHNSDDEGLTRKAYLPCAQEGRCPTWTSKHIGSLRPPQRHL
jgi:hypothetical protein